MKKQARKIGQNVFLDLGFSERESANLQIRASMMNALIAEIEKQEWTQAAAARVLGVTQPRVSDLMRGKIELFSIDMLVNMLAAVGLRVDVRVRKAA